MLQTILDFVGTTGFPLVTWQQAVMWAVVLVLFYLAVFKEFEPLLLVPIGFGALMGVLGGLFPAIRAARISPIAAMRD